MNMMRIHKYCITRGVTDQRIQTLINSGFLKVVAIEGARLIDADMADRLFREIGYRGTGGERYGNLKTLVEETGLSYRQINRIIRDGWIKPINDTGRALYDIEACKKAIVKHEKRFLKGPVDKDDRAKR